MERKISRGVKKYIRTQKAKLRRMITDPEQLKQEFIKLYEQLPKKKGN